MRPPPPRQKNQQQTGPKQNMGHALKDQQAGNPYNAAILKLWQLSNCCCTTAVPHIKGIDGDAVVQTTNVTDPVYEMSDYYIHKCTQCFHLQPCQVTLSVMVTALCPSGVKSILEPQ